MGVAGTIVDQRSALDPVVNTVAAASAQTRACCTLPSAHTHDDTNSKVALAGCPTSRNTACHCHISNTKTYVCLSAEGSVAARTLFFL